VLLQGFFIAFASVGCWFQSASTMFQSASAVPCARIDNCLCSVHTRKSSRASSPRAWAQSRHQGVLSILCIRPFSVLPRDRG
jgi:hypothetical protein